MTDTKRKEVVIQEFLPLFSSEYTKTLDLILKNGIFKANDINVTKGVRELNAPSLDTAYEADRIEEGKERKSIRGTVSNITEIITKYVSFTDTDIALESNRLHTEIQDAIVELKQDFNLHIWQGTKRTTQPRKMAGLLKQIPASNKVAKAEITKQDFIDAVNLAKKVGSVSHIFGNYDAIKNIAAILKADEARMQNDGTIALDLEKIIVSGQTLTPVIDPQVPAGTVVIGNSAYLEMYVLTALRQVDLARTGRTVDAMVDMEATVLCRNPKNFVILEESEEEESEE